MTRYERTEMSRNLKLKKVAIVAISALGLGLFSGGTANAAFPATDKAVNAVGVTDSSFKVVLGQTVATTITAGFNGATAAEDVMAASIEVTTKPTGSTVATDDQNGGTAGSDPIASNAGIDEEVLTSVTLANGDTTEDVLVITAEGVIADATNNTVIGTLTLVPDVAGTYVITLKGSSAADPAVENDAVAATLTIEVVSTNASGDNDWGSDSILDCQTGYTTTEALGCSQVVKGRVTIDVTTNELPSRAASGNADYFIEVSGASLVSVNTTSGGDDIDFGYGSGVVNTTVATLDWPGAGNLSEDQDGLIAVHSNGTPAAAGEEDFVITRSTAGTTTITLFYFNALGQKVTYESHTVSWISAATAGVSASRSLAGWVDAAADCAGATEAAARSALASNKITVAPGAPTNDTAFLCVFSFDGNGVVVDPASIEVAMSKGNIRSADGAAVTTSRVTESTAATLDGVDIFEGFGDVDELGLATATITITDQYANDAVLTATLTWYGDIASITLSNGAYAAGLDTLESNDSSAADADAIYLVAKDAAGNVINLEQVANGLATGTGNLRVDSTYATVAADADAEGESDADAAVTIGDLTGDGSTTAYISVNCDNSAEILSITAYGLNDLLADVVSNTITFNCSGSASTVEMTLGADSLAAGANTTVQVVVKDSGGRPVADGTSVTLAATIGGVVAPSSKTTYNGTFLVPATLIAGDQNGSMTVTAISSNGKTASKVVKVGTGEADSAANAAADAAAEAIDAANAATDAANLAAEAADAATVAAEEARDAADAATAAVEALATEVATLMAALKAQITTLANTVAKIAKKVKA